MVNRSGRSISGRSTGASDRDSVDPVSLSLSSSDDVDVVSNRMRLLVSPKRRSDASLLNIVTSLAQFGEIMRIDMNSFQYDSTIIVCYFDIRAAALARHSLLNDPDSAFSRISEDGQPCTLEREVRVVGFLNTDQASNCNDLLLSVFSRFGEVETISRTGAGSFIVTFFDSRSPLAVFATLFPDRPEPRSFTVSSEELIKLLIAGSETRVISKPSMSSESASSVEFAVDLSSLESGNEKRTTVMIRNIPRKMSQSTIVDIVRFSLGKEDIFDFIYLPMDLANHINVGYAFVNLKSPEFVITFYQLFNNRTWRSILGTFRIAWGEEASKVAKVTFARIQGVDSLINHFANTSIMNHQPDSVRPYFRL